jgi:predicted O-linked N-acetylglucosamine transferase (SPINDLY family)
MFNTFHLFKNIGDADKHYNYAQEGLDYLHKEIIRNPQSNMWKDITLTQYFVKNSTFSTMSFTSVNNLKKMAIQRSEILHQYLLNTGFQMKYSFPPRSGKIRLGIISENYTTRSETFASLPIFEYLNREQFDIYLFSYETHTCPIEEHCRNCADHFILLPLDIGIQIEILRNANLDILFFATNLTAKLKRATTILAMNRLARVQINSICSPFTTGMNTMDYYLSGNLLTPLPDYQLQYHEKLINIEGSGICFQFPISDMLTDCNRSREDWHASKDMIIFMSGANVHKIIPEVRYTWAEIIANIKNSMLVLFPFNPVNWGAYESAQLFVDEMKSIFSKFGIHENRLIFENPLPSIADVRAILRLADIYLDSFPYSGATSLIDPLSVGLPPVVYEGDALRFRQGAAMLREINLSDLIVKDEKDYVKLAIDLANQSQKRAYLRNQIISKMQNNPPFLNSKLFAKKVTGVFQTIVKTL